MNNPNPFVPKGSLLEQQSQRRSRLKLAVFCVLAVSVTGLVAMLIQGCKRENPDQNAAGNLSADTNMAPLDMTNATAMDTNTSAPLAAPVTPATNTLPPVPIAPVAPVAPTPQATEAPAAGSEYVVVAGDTLAKIAKAHGVTLKALEAANPGVDPKKLKLKQKLVIPAGAAGASAMTSGAAPAVTAEGGVQEYTVKSGDTLTKIAKHFGISVKALRSANSLTTDHISVGKKLKIPVKAETVAPVVAPATDTSAAPMLPPTTAPAPAPATPATGR